MEIAIFFVFAGLAVGCAVNLVLQRHPISGAVSLIGVMCSLAVLYLQLGAEFIAAAQVIVYAGAIMVLFVFVIMLLNAEAEQGRRVSYAARYIGLPALAVFAALAGLLVRALAPAGVMVRFGEFVGGTARNVGRLLFRRYLLPFELTSALILIAILGAIVLGRKEVE